MKEFFVIIFAILVALVLSGGCKGAPGMQGPAGEQGEEGSVGSVGAVGPAGPAGSNGTIITVVQFCQGTSGSEYPTTFPEVGLCINGNIYAVYSANDGFLTEIVPGVYDSNAVGSACTFTVEEGCLIKH